MWLVQMPAASTMPVLLTVAIVASGALLWKHPGPGPYGLYTAHHDVVEARGVEARGTMGRGGLLRRRSTQAHGALPLLSTKSRGDPDHQRRQLGDSSGSGSGSGSVQAAAPTANPSARGPGPVMTLTYGGVDCATFTEHMSVSACTAVSNDVETRFPLISITSRRTPRSW